MFLYLSKALPQFVFPPGLVILLLLAALILRRRRPGLATAAILSGVAILWLSGTQVIAELLMHTLEAQYPEIAVEQAPTADAIVVLGGYLHSANRNHAKAELNESADRLWMGARLYKAGKAPLVLLSGGAVPLFGPTASPESVDARALLEQWGVAREAIEVETQSRTTYENAADSKRILERKGAKRLLLVTSAFHMPRAMAIFRRQGLQATAIPTDYRSGWTEEDTFLRWMPNSEDMNRTCVASREWIGFLVYRLRGWA